MLINGQELYFYELQLHIARFVNIATAHRLSECTVYRTRTHLGVQCICTTARNQLKQVVDLTQTVVERLLILRTEIVTGDHKSKPCKWRNSVGRHVEHMNPIRFYQIMGEDKNSLRWILIFLGKSQTPLIDEQNASEQFIVNLIVPGYSINILLASYILDRTLSKRM